MIVLLENIRSKFNVGSIFRTSEFLSFEKIILTWYTPQLPDIEISKTAIWAEENVPFQYWQNSIDVIKDLKKQGIKIISAELTDKSIKLPDFKIDKNDNYVIVLWNEITWVSKEVLELSDFIVEIPMLGKMKESLNVEVSFGIIASWMQFK